MMESSAETPGKFYVGDGDGVFNYTCILSVHLENVSTLETWDHQRADFIRGHINSHLYSGVADEMFVLHLLEVHANSCKDSMCKCRCSSINIVDVGKGPSEVDSSLEGFENDRLQGFTMEPPDVSHDQQKDVMTKDDNARSSLLVAVEIKVEEETSEVPSEVALPNTTENDRLQWVAMESPDMSHDQWSDVVAVKIKVEDETSEDNVDPQEGENISLAGKRIPSSDLEEWTRVQARQEGETGTCSSTLHPGMPTEEKPFSCWGCPKTFMRRYDLSRHIRTHTRVGHFSCNICNRVFLREHNLVQHMKIHTSSTTFSCPACPKSFALKNYLTKHMRTHTNERPFSCDICQKTFSSKGSMKQHQVLHTGERDFICDICQKDFSKKYSLKEHMKTHTGEKSYSCDTCAKAFSKKCTLTQHIKIHTGERPSCDICKKTFSQKGSLKTHMRSHTGERPFSCSICQRDFSDQSGLWRHSRIHTDERPFSCSICDMACRQKSDLTKHMRTHTGLKIRVRTKQTGERPFSCDLCKKTFSVSSSLRKHVRTMHSGDGPSSCDKRTKTCSPKVVSIKQEEDT